jgi:hypothetical protein
MINPAKAASQFLAGSHESEYGNSLRSLFTKQLGQPENIDSKPTSTLSADYANTEFRPVGRPRASTSQATGLHAVGSLKPVLGSQSRVFERADAIHAEKLKAIADNTMKTFSANASGKPSLAISANIPAAPDKSKISTRPQAPVSYASLEMDTLS